MLGTAPWFEDDILQNYCDALTWDGRRIGTKGSDMHLAYTVQ